jgi:hypothetical protein
VQQFIHQRGLAVVNVGDNGDVSDLRYFHKMLKIRLNREIRRKDN